MAELRNKEISSRRDAGYAAGYLARSGGILGEPVAAQQGLCQSTTREMLSWSAKLLTLTLSSPAPTSPLPLQHWEARHQRPYLDPTQAAYARLPQCTKVPPESSRLHPATAVAFPGHLACRGTEAGCPKQASRATVCRGGVRGDIERAGPQLSLERGVDRRSHPNF